VADIDATHARLADRGVPFDVLGNSLLVPATHAAGATVTFRWGTKYPWISN
jgi:hypothetical protein